MFVYLDTSFLSQFAKTDMGKLKASPHTEKWRELLACLRQEVQRGTLICPGSGFQLEEASLSPNLEPELIRVQLELSKGYFFKYWEDILVHQTANEVLIHLGRSQDIDLGWRAFTKQAPDIAPPWAVKIAKENVRRFVEESKKKGVIQNSYAEQYEEERISLLQESFLQPLRRLQGLDTYLKYPDPMLGILIREAKISEQEFPKVLEFFESDLVDRIAYIHIYCSINASLRIHEGTRKTKSSDFYDLPALACAMRYCSTVTTDANMKAHVVDRLHLDEKYGTRVFSGKAEDLAAMLKEISSTTH